MTFFLKVVKGGYSTPNPKLQTFKLPLQLSFSASMRVFVFFFFFWGGGRRGNQGAQAPKFLGEVDLEKSKQLEATMFLKGPV